jgi:hypothetical protein
LQGPGVPPIRSPSFSSILNVTTHDGMNGVRFSNLCFWWQVGNLAAPSSEWTVGGTNLTSLMCVEKRKGESPSLFQLPVLSSFSVGSHVQRQKCVGQPNFHAVVFTVLFEHCFGRAWTLCACVRKLHGVRYVCNCIVEGLIFRRSRSCLA